VDDDQTCLFYYYHTIYFSSDMLIKSCRQYTLLHNFAYVCCNPWAKIYNLSRRYAQMENKKRL